MMNAHSKIKEAIDSLPVDQERRSRATDARSKRAKAIAEGKDIRASFVIENHVYKQIIEHCDSHHMAQQEFLERATDTYLKSLGMPGYGEKR